MKIPSVGAELFHAGGQTDRHEEGNISFCNFANAREKMDKRKRARYV
jgi:hypothetical protein